MPESSPTTSSAPTKPNRRYLKATLAGSAGGLLAVLLFLLEERPELARLLLERVVIAWGPQFVIVLLLFAFLYLLADRYAPRLIAAQSETALALQNLARSVEQLVARENTFQREQDVLLNHVARRVDALYKLLESHLSRLPRRSGAKTPSLPKGAKARGAKSRGHRRLNGHLARLSRTNVRGLGEAKGRGRARRRPPGAASASKPSRQPSPKRPPLIPQPSPPPPDEA